MDWSEINFTIPKEILLHIVSFMEDKTKRQMRLANTTWFNLIHYSNFTLYFTTLERLPEITERLSTYKAPIGVKFVKPLVSKMDQWIAHLPKLTNVNSLSFQASEHTSVKLEDWLKMTALSNLETWTLPYYCPDQVVAKLHNLTSLNVQSVHSWDVLKDELPKFTKLISLNIAHNTTVQDLDLSLLSPKLTFLEFSAVISGKGISKLTNLKSIHYYQLDHVPQEPFPFFQLSGLEILSLDQKNLLDVPQFPRNITSLSLSGKNISPECRAGLAQLDKLKVINIGNTVVPDTTHNFLTAMTALEDFTLWPSIDSEFNFPWQNTTGACLSYLRSDKITALTLGITPFTKNLDHLSKLTNIEDIFIYEEGVAQTEIDYGSIGHMTKLSSLMIYASASRPSLLCLTDLASLKHLVVDSSDGDENTFDDRLILTRLTNLQRLSLNGCTRATVANLSTLTNLRVIHSPLIFPDIDYSFLTAMELTALSVKNAVEDNESFWNVLPKLTSIAALELRGVIFEGNIICLTALQHLTQLYVRYSDQFKGDHLTVLTTVQRLIVNSTAAKGYLKQEELLKKMPLLTYVSLY